MNLGEILAASVGLSLDVYAVAVCKGAKIRKIDGRKLAQMCLIFTGWQMCALLIGNLIMLVPVFAGESERFSLIWSGLSALIDQCGRILGRNRVRICGYLPVFGDPCDWNHDGTGSYHRNCNRLSAGI